MSALTEHAVRFARHRRLLNPDTAYGQCVIQTDALLDNVPSAHAIRVTGLNYPGREHWAAVEWSDDGDADPSEFTVVDLTARQFDATIAVPWIGTLADWLDLTVDWLADHVNVEVHRAATHDAPVWTEEYASRDDVEEAAEPMRAWA